MALSLYHPDAHALAHAMVRQTPIHPIRVQNAITVADLRATMRQREETQRAGYGACLERCYARVRRCASVGRTECVFQVPHAVAGMPLYDVGKCTDYVVAHLKRNGFRVTYGDYGEYDLRVSWDVGIQEEDEDDGYDFGRPEDHRHPPSGVQSHKSPHHKQKSQHTTTTFGSAFGGISRMSRDEQMRHIEYVIRQQQQQPQPPAQHQPIPRPANKGARSASPPGFLRSIAEFKPSGKFVLRV